MKFFEGVTAANILETQAPTSDLGYASNVNRDTILQNPDFISDLRKRYDPLGVKPDEDLIDEFYSDENWATLNTVGAVSRGLSGGGDTDDEKLMNARLTSVFDQLPSFLADGGRGIKAVPDILEAVIKDPINLIGGVAAKGVAATAMRTSVAQGTAKPIASTLRGVGAAGLTEGGISAGQEAAINVSEQSYRTDIGLQTEFDYKQFRNATLIGLGMGAGVGAAIGLPFAIAGTRQGAALGRADVAEAAAKKIELDEQAAAARAEVDARRQAFEGANAGGKPPEGPAAGTQKTTTKRKNWDGSETEVEVEAETPSEAPKKTKYTFKNDAQKARMEEAAADEAVDFNEAVQAAVDSGDLELTAKGAIKVKHASGNAKQSLKAHIKKTKQASAAPAPEADFTVDEAGQATPNNAAAPAATKTQDQLRADVQDLGYSGVAARNAVAARKAAAPDVEEPTPADASLELEFGEEPPTGREYANNAASATVEKPWIVKAVSSREDFDQVVADSITPNSKGMINNKMYEDALAERIAVEAIGPTSTGVKAAVSSGEPDAPPSGDSLSDYAAQLSVTTEEPKAVVKPRAKSRKETFAEKVGFLGAKKDYSEKLENATDETKPYIPAKVMEKLQDEGINPDDIPPMKQKGGSWVVNGKALNAWKKDTGFVSPDEAAAKTSQNEADDVGHELDEILERIKDAAGDGDTDLTVEQIKPLIRAFATDGNYEASAEEILSLYDKAAKKDAAADAADRAILAEVDAKGLKEYFNAQEIRNIRSYIKKLTEGEMPRNEAVRNAIIWQYKIRNNAVGRVKMQYLLAKEKFDSEQLRMGSSAALERQSIFGTVGRLQSIVRPAIASSGGRSLISAGLGVTEDVFVSAQKINQTLASTRAQTNMRANERGTTLAQIVARQKGLTPAKAKNFITKKENVILINGKEGASPTRTILPDDIITVNEAKMEHDVVDRPTIIPFVSDAPVRAYTMKDGVQSRVTAARGTLLYADGAQGGRFFDSEEVAMAYRGYKYGPDGTKGDASLVAGEAAETGEGIKSLLEQITAGDLRPTGQRLETDTIDFRNNPPIMFEDMVAIVRKISDPEDIRVPSASRLRVGGNIQTIIGENSDPSEWEIKYFPKVKHSARLTSNNLKRDNAGKKAVWDTAVSLEGGDGTMIVSYAGDVTATGMPILHERMGEIPLDRSTFTEAEEAAFSSHAAGKMKTSQKLTAADVIAVIERAENAPLSKNINETAKLISDLENLYALSRKSLPEGFVRPSVDRAHSLEQLQSIFNGDHPEDLRAAMRLIADLGGDPNRAPVFSQKDGAFEYNAETNQIEGEMPALPENRTPELMRAMASWSYHNILTPEQRLEFWGALKGHIVKYENADFLKNLGDYKLGNRGAASRIFADQFVAWGLQNRAKGLFNKPSFWDTVVRTIRAAYQRYFLKEAIDPAFEPTFSKILPEELRLKRKFDDFVESSTSVGAHIDRYRNEIATVRETIQDGINAQSDGSIIEGFDQLRRLLASISPRRASAYGLGNDPIGATFAPLMKFDGMIRGRLADINEVMSGKPFGSEANKLSDAEHGEYYQQGFSKNISNPEKMGEMLQDIYDSGHLGSFEPSVRPTGGKKDNTSIVYLLDMLEGEANTQYARYESGQYAATPINSGKGASIERNAAVRKLLKRKRAQNNAALEDVGEGSKVRLSRAEKNMPKEALPYVHMNISELLNEYKTKTAARGEDLSPHLINQLIDRAQHLTLEDFKGGVKVRKEIRDAQWKNIIKIRPLLSDALDRGDQSYITEMLAEIAARQWSKKGKYAPQQLLDVKFLRQRIATEIDQGIGQQTEVGIPPSAPFGVRNMLSYLTHRDPRVNYVQRTMAYRMLNLMGKTTRNVLNETNVMDASDIARLAGVDPTGLRNVSMDFRGAEFKNFRNQTRRLAVGLTKGSSNPFDVVHETAHTIIRAGMLPKKEMDAVVEMYRGATDEIKERIVKSYGDKPRYKDLSETEMEALLAEEWFAEGMANYLGERTGKGDILNALSSGNFDAIRIRGTVSTAIDRVREMLAYIYNGLFNRKNTNIRQTYRQLMFFGNMTEKPVKGVLARLAKKPVAVHASLADQYAADFLRESSATRNAKIKEFTGGGKYSEDANGAPIQYYHATPNGTAFNKSNNPVVEMNKGDGLYGPAVYISPNAQTLDAVYAQRPSARQLDAIIEGTDLPEEAKEEMRMNAASLEEVRRLISQRRRDWSSVEMELEAYQQQGDTPTDIGSISFAAMDRESQLAIRRDEAKLLKSKEDLQDDLDELLEEEDWLVQEMESAGVKGDPLVMPLFTRMQNTADFSVDGEHEISGPFFQSFFKKLIKDGSFTKEELDLEVGKHADKPMRGDNAYRTMTQVYLSSGLSLQNARASVNATLESLGYDSMKTTHMNTLTDAAAGADEMYSGEFNVYDGFLVFDPSNVKHSNADFFDHTDARLYFRDVGEPVDFNGALASEMSAGNIDRIDPANATEMLDTLETRGTPPELVSSMGAILRERSFTVTEEAAVRKLSPLGFLNTQSSRMKSLGMNFMGDWYKDHFPNMAQTFGGKYMPIHRAMRSLDGADGKVKAWAKASDPTGKFSKQTPAYNRIVSALRHGTKGGVPSRQLSSLSVPEREVYDMIRSRFQQEHIDMREAGIYVGHKPEYMPQVWNSEAIRKNADGFKAAMAQYYRLEQTSLNKIPTPEDTTTFVNRLYETLAGLDDADGIQNPTKGSTKTSTADSLDFSRMIQLEKYPSAMDMMEPFLESDLEFLLVKYFEGSTRKILHTKKFGVNNHGVDDYLTASSEGAKGIAKLMSTNKVYTKNFRVVDGDGVVEVDLKDETAMPFSTSKGRALEFAEILIDVHNSHGAPAAREMLDRAAPKTANGTVSQTYNVRADAIMGALGDYKGVATPIDNDASAFLENAMRVSNKKPLTGTVGGKPALKVSRGLRQFNNLTLLSFTTLSSLGDVALPIIRSGSFRSWAKATKNLAAGDPDYKRAFSNIGVAMENIVHDRMIHMYGAVDSKVSNAFFNATMLTPWTDLNRQVAGAVAYESFVTYQTKARNSYVPNTPIEQQPRAFKTAYRYLNQFGLGDYAKGQAKGDISLTDRSLLDFETGDPLLRTAVIKFANESVFQPNPDDIPLWAQTPFGALAFQLKSFPTMMMRMKGYAVREAAEGNFKPMGYYLALGPAFGMGAMSVKDIVQSRGGEDQKSPELRTRNFLKFAGFDEKVHGDGNDFLGWYLEGMAQMGGFGLIIDILHSAATQADNASYGHVRMLSTLGGPSVGLVSGGMNMLGAVKDAALDTTPDSNSKERAGANEIAARIPIAGGIRPVKQAMIDFLAGEPKSTASGSFSSSFSNSFKKN